ncbi:hypothetical protein KAX75_09845 [candidate division WOR-3 bacterium]|nr:hypothetical protein [candidate division WOR-3 bacterium]
MEGLKRIKVYLNGKPVYLFKGMKVKHILTEEMLKDVRGGHKIVIDDDGHERGLEGSLTNGEKFFLKNKNFT